MLRFPLFLHSASGTLKTGYRCLGPGLGSAGTQAASYDIGGVFCTSGRPPSCLEISWAVGGGTWKSGDAVEDVGLLNCNFKYCLQA